MPSERPPVTTECLDVDDFAVPADRRYFEDYPVGAVHHYGTVELTTEEMISFARQFDPQDMHINAALAARSPAGELIASGMLTASLVVRLLVDHVLSRVATLPSPGITQMRFPSPVRPGDQLSLEVEIISARPSESDSGRAWSLPAPRWSARTPLPSQT